jgi:quercetin dioxygenase-like cupin family protein
MTDAYAWVDVDDVPFTWGTFSFVGHRLGATALGFSQVDFPPGKVGAEHDEVESGQEEVYVCLAGGGTLTVDGDELELVPGRYVLVSPEARRRPAAGPEGLSFLVVGGVPGGVYEPRDPPAD